jgi:hypothetical protein
MDGPSAALLGSCYYLPSDNIDPSDVHVKFLINVLKDQSSPASAVEQIVKSYVRYKSRKNGKDVAMSGIDSSTTCQVQRRELAAEVVKYLTQSSGGPSARGSPAAQRDVIKTSGLDAPLLLDAMAVFYQTAYAREISLFVANALGSNPLLQQQLKTAMSAGVDALRSLLVDAEKLLAAGAGSTEVARAAAGFTLSRLLDSLTTLRAAAALSPHAAYYACYATLPADASGAALNFLNPCGLPAALVMTYEHTIPALAAVLIPPSHASDTFAALEDSPALRALRVACACAVRCFDDLVALLLLAPFEPGLTAARLPPPLREALAALCPAHQTRPSDAASSLLSVFATLSAPSSDVYQALPEACDSVSSVRVTGAAMPFFKDFCSLGASPSRVMILCSTEVAARSRALPLAQSQLSYLRSIIRLAVEPADVPKIPHSDASESEADSSFTPQMTEVASVREILPHVTDDVARSALKLSRGDVTSAIERLLASQDTELHVAESVIRHADTFPSTGDDDTPDGVVAGSPSAPSAGDLEMWHALRMKQAYEDAAAASSACSILDSGDYTTTLLKNHSRREYDDEYDDTFDAEGGKGPLPLWLTQAEDEEGTPSTEIGGISSRVLPPSAPLSALASSTAPATFAVEASQGHNSRAIKSRKGNHSRKAGAAKKMEHGL